jgi:uroporphyrinogen-III synthase
MPRVLITRSPHQASALADLLRASGLEPILIPTIELAPPTTFAPLDAALAHLDRFHWLLFTSANAVEAFATRLPNPYSLIPTPCRIAAIGPATARALEAIGLAPTLIPPQAVAESLAAALLPHATPGTRFLLIRAEAARDVLPETLTAAGAEVTIAPAYRTVIPTGSIPQLRALFHSPPATRTPSPSPAAPPRPTFWHCWRPQAFRSRRRSSASPLAPSPPRPCVTSTCHPTPKPPSPPSPPSSKKLSRP